MPYFLWRNVIAYCDTKSILKFGIDSDFNDILKDSWEDRFKSIKGSIAIVRSTEKYAKLTGDNMDSFWRYACYYHTNCISIADMFSKVEIDNMASCTNTSPSCLGSHSQDIINYRIYVNQGIYTIDGDYQTYHFDHTQCTIEVIGSTHEFTRGMVDNTVIGYVKARLGKFDCIYTSSYFSMTNIMFYDFNVEFRSDYVTKLSKIELSNCMFNAFCGTGLKLVSIDDVIISGCTFANKFFHTLIKSRDHILPKINYVLTHNIFVNSDSASISFGRSICDPASVIVVDSNNISSSKVFLENYLENVPIIVKNNTIKNIYVCMERDYINLAAVFENNTLINVGGMSNYIKFGIIQLNVGNKFIN